MELASWGGTSYDEAMKARAVQILIFLTLVCLVLSGMLLYWLIQPIQIQDLSGEYGTLKGLSFDYENHLRVESLHFRLKEGLEVEASEVNVGWDLSRLFDKRLEVFGASSLWLRLPETREETESPALSEEEISSLFMDALRPLQEFEVARIYLPSIQIEPLGLALSLPEASFTSATLRLMEPEVTQAPYRVQLKKLEAQAAASTLNLKFSDLKILESSQLLLALEKLGMTLVQEEEKPLDLQVDLESAHFIPPRTSAEKTSAESVPPRELVLPSLPLSVSRLAATSVSVDRLPLKIQLLQAFLQKDSWGISRLEVQNSQHQTFLVTSAVLNPQTLEWQAGLKGDGFILDSGEFSLPLDRLQVSVQGQVRGKGLDSFEGDLLYDTEIQTQNVSSRLWGSVRKQSLYLDLNPVLSAPYGNQGLGSISLIADLKMPEVLIRSIRAERLNLPMAESSFASLEMTGQVDLKTLGWNFTADILKLASPQIRASGFQMRASGVKTVFQASASIQETVLLTEVLLHHPVLEVAGKDGKIGGALEFSELSLKNSRLKQPRIDFDWNTVLLKLKIAHEGGLLKPQELGEWASSLPSSGAETQTTSTGTMIPVSIYIEPHHPFISVIEEGMILDMYPSGHVRVDKKGQLSGSAIFRVPRLVVDTMGLHLEATKPGRLQWVNSRDGLDSEELMEFTSSDLGAQLGSMWSEGQSQSHVETGVLVELQLLAEYQGSRYQIHTSGWYPHLFWKLTNLDGEDEDGVLGAILKTLAGKFGETDSDGGGEGFLSPTMFQNHRNTLVNAGLGALLNQNMPQQIRLQADVMGDQKTVGIETTAKKGLSFGVKQESGTEGDSRSHSVQWNLNSSMKFEMEDTSGDKEEQQFRMKRSIRF